MSSGTERPSAGRATSASTPRVVASGGRSSTLWSRLVNWVRHLRGHDWVEQVEFTETGPQSVGFVCWICGHPL